MDASTIIGQLAANEGLPREAIRAASERRAEMVPLFIAEIETYIDATPAERPAGDSLFLIFHLLGEWRETSAYPALARLLAMPEDDVETVLGDATTETSQRVMAAVFDGDPKPLCDIIRAPDASEYIRARMCEVLAALVWLGKLDRDAAADFLRECFSEMQPQDTNFVWHGWQMAIVMLGLTELTPMVEEAFKRKFIGTDVCAFEDFQSDMEQALAAPGLATWEHNGPYEPLSDTIEELSKWHGFSEEGRREREQDKLDWESMLPGGEPAINPHRNVGRNDPCPCGSGKKFKKCCLQ